MNRPNLLILATYLLASPLPSGAGDWPQWRCDPQRSGISAQALPAAVADLQLRWSRKLPALQPAFRDGRLQFDSGYEPVVLGKRLFLGSSRDDSLIALDTETGEILWRFVTGGPIRFAPVAWETSVFVGSDDGNLYCLDAEDGSLRWKFKAVPSDRLVWGNRRLISTWPVRGGPVLRDGRIYFAAGVWSFEGVFVYALDAATGEIIWRNDNCSYIYGTHPHNAVAFGGLAPQGYLLVNDDELVVPSSSAYPARFDLATGKLLDFQLPAAGRKPGGWFVATGGDPGDSKLGLLPASEVAQKRALLYEKDVNRSLHEGDMMTGEGVSGIRTAIRAAGEHLKFSDPLPEIDEPVHSMLVADEKLFVVTTEGRINCLGKPEPGVAARHYSGSKEPRATDPSALALLERTGNKHGLAVLLGLPDDVAFTETLATQSMLTLVAIDSSTSQIASSRKSLIASGLYGHRASIRKGDPLNCKLPPYLAQLIVSRHPVSLETLQRISNSVRPFGGKLVVPHSDPLAGEELPGFQRTASGGQLIFTRTALPGSSNYTGGFEPSVDQLVRAPLGVLWYDDTLGHFKRSPQPRFVDGVMITADKTWLDTSTRTDTMDFRLRPAVFSDVYTGRILTKEETPLLSSSLAEVDQQTVQPKQYRPASQKDAWKPKQPNSGVRLNPLTGLEEARTFPKSYGCDGGVDYGDIYTMRSGTAAFYDKQLESGTINLSGPRSGCTNSIIPANGVLNVPYFFEGCTCSYPLPTALALVSMPKTHEQWASWGDVATEALQGKIERVGINFGAPGDRMTDEGTLWLDYPNVGGPSPQVRVDIQAKDQPRYEYQHSLWIKNHSPEAWPWVAGSAVIGATEISVHSLKNGNYEVNLHFAELDEEGKQERRFDIAVQGITIRSDFSPAKTAGDNLTGTVLSVPSTKVNDGSVRIQLSAKSGTTSLSGIELIRKAGS